MSKETVFVAGAGLMGRDISLLFANYGFKVILFDISKEALDKTYKYHRKITPSFYEKGLLDDESVYENITYTEDISSVHEANFVFEAIVEDLEVKRRFFMDIEKYLSKDIIFATNTSSYTVSEIASALDYPSRFGAMHFSNPPIEMDLIEVARGAETSDETINELISRSEDLGKTPVLLDKECRGFVLNRLLYVAFVDALIRIENGEKPQDIDLGVKNLGVPFGVVEAMDLIGIDTTLRILDNLVEAYGERYIYPKDILLNLIQEGKLGKKTGQGFYRWVEGEARIPEGNAADPMRVVAVVYNEAYKIESEGVASKDRINKIYVLGVKAPVGIYDVVELFRSENLAEILMKLYKDIGHPVYHPSFET